jgi:hypothetical protein
MVSAMQAGALTYLEDVAMPLSRSLKIALSVGALAVTALPLPGAAQTQAEAEAALAAAFTAAGCRATPETSADVFAASGLSDEAFMAAGQAMMEDGRIVQTAEEVRYTGGACAGTVSDAAPAGAERLIEAVRANGCAVTDAEAEAVLAPLGDLDATRDAVAALVQGGGAALVRVENALLLSEAVCTGSAAGGRFEPARLGAANLFLRQMQGWGCAAARANVDRAFDEMSLADPDALLAALVTAGAIEDGGDFIGLARPSCLAGPGELRQIAAAALGG